MHLPTLLLLSRALVNNMSLLCKQNTDFIILDISQYIHLLYRYLKKQFNQADKNENGKLSVDECKKLIEQLNAKIPKDEIEKLYAQSDTNRDELDEEDFIGFYYSLLNRRPELDEVFIKYSNSSNKKGKMTAEDLSNFLNHEQKIELPLEVCTFFFR